MDYSSPARSRHSQSSSSSRSPLERRNCLRGVLDRTKYITEVGWDSMKNLNEIVKEADTISSEAPIDEKVTNHDEVIMDSEVMATSSRLVKSNMDGLMGNLSPYSMTLFSEKLLQYVHTTHDETLNTANWALLENELPKLFRRTPKYTFMSGCLDQNKVIEKRQLVKRQKDALAPIKRPDAIVEVGDKVDGQVDEIILKIKKLIAHHQKTTGSPLELFRLIIHPNDFGKTVENMLHVSFLVRDGILQILLDDDGNPVILSSTKQMRSDFKNATKKTNIQNIVSISYEQWQTLVDDLGIQVPMIDFH